MLRQKTEITWVPEPRCSSPPGAWYNKVALGHLPESRAAEAKLSSALLEQGKLETAEQHLARAARLDPASFEAHAYLAECLRKQGKSEEAFGEYQKAIALRGR